tara:strand:- start:114 stop:683 length:570 start_codon:yes stop_codon:yes gene_type:complete
MITAILLAAGESKRMNGENKLLKKVDRVPLIKHSVKNILNSSVDELIIITGHQSNEIKKIIDKNKKIKFVYNDKYKDGMSSSIKAGLQNLSKKTHAFFISLGDMPEVNKEIYNNLIKQLKNNKIIVPTYKNKQGNPVLFSKSFKEKIMTIEGDIGAKKILEKHREIVLNVETNSRSILKNYNTPEIFDN